MASQKQIEANKANAKKSTGPKTEAGKLRSSMNAVTHGLTATSILIRGESAEDFETLRAALEKEYQPQGAVVVELLGHLLGLLWRLRRGAPSEASLIEARVAEVATPLHDESDDLDRVALGDALIHDASDNDALGKLTQREARLNREVEKTLKMLRGLREAA
jgi:hypothetical protein